MTDRNDSWRTDAALDRMRARARLVLFWAILTASVAIGFTHAESVMVNSIANALASIPSHD